MPRPVLGRGLKALISEGAQNFDGNSIVEVPIDRIQPNPYQARRSFDDERLAELAESIKGHGILQPLLVRRRGEGFELAAGERRWRAARLAGLTTVPVVVKEMGDEEIARIGLVENLQREDLNPMEEARAYKRLIDEFGVTQDDLAETLGKSRPAITNTLRLLNLPDEIQGHVSRGTISMGHARALLALEDAQLQVQVCNEIIAKGISVRQTEELVRKLTTRKAGLASGRPRAQQRLDPDLENIRERIEQALGTRVLIRPGRKKGRIEIEYYSDEDLQRILEALI